MILNKYLKLRDITFSTSIADDIFRDLRKIGVKELIVNCDEMFIIVSTLVYNAQGSPENVQILKEGEVDKFLGVKLKLE